MGGVSRYDFFRIVLPGALVVFLLDLGARLILATPDIGPSMLASFPSFIEQPLIALAATFAIGLVLYSLDLAYYSPQFWRGIPSTILRERIPDQQVDTTSLFFVAADKLMSPDLRERALSYGAFYRLGFQLIFFTILTCLVVPVGIVLRLADPPLIRHPRVGGALLFAIVLVLPCALTPFVREAFKKRRRPPSLRFTLGFLTVVMVSSTVWMNLPYGYLPGSPQKAIWLILATSAVGVPWSALRLLGPLAPRWAVWRSEEKIPRPDVPHKDLEIAILDTGAALSSLVAAVALSGVLADMQIVGLALLQMLALVLSFQKKHERQLQGIYRNQVTWLDGNLDEILKLVPQQRSPTASPQVMHSPPSPSQLPKKSGSKRPRRASPPPDP